MIMIVLGIDPGTARTGFAVLKKTKGKKGNLELLDSGCITTPASLSPEKRLAQIYKKLKKLIAVFKPDIMAIEELFFNINVKTALSVGKAQGAIMLAAHDLGLPIAFYTPLQVKTAVCGYGRADKTQVQKMVKRLLSLAEIPKSDDTADAIAIALCHTATGRIKR